MPPVLDISLPELTGSAKQKLVANETWFSVNQRHHILQLVTETESAAGLIISATRPETARQRLVQEPAIRHHVDGLVRCIDIHGAESMRPVMPYRLQGSTGGFCAAKALHQFHSARGALAYTEN